MKPTNIQNVLAGLEPMKKEKQLKCEFGDQTLEKLLAIFEPEIDGPKYGYSGSLFDYYKDIIGSLNVQINNKLINDIVVELAAYQNEKEFSDKSGPFISALMQVAYAQGRNNFEIDIRPVSSQIDWLCAHFSGKEDIKLTATITGNAGEFFSMDSDWCDLTINGHVMRNCGDGARYLQLKVFGDAGYYFGGNSRDSKFFIKGNAVNSLTFPLMRGHFGMRAENCEYKIIGNAGSGCGWESKNCNFDVTGNAGFGCALAAEGTTMKVIGEVEAYLLAQDAKNTVFKFTDKRALEVVKKLAGKGCKLYLIEKGGDSLYAET